MVIRYEPVGLNLVRSTILNSAYPDAVFASDLRSIRVRDPARRVYRAIMEVRALRDEAERRGRSAKDGVDSNASTNP